MNFKIIIVIFFLLSCAALQSQEVWNLNDCISYAIQHNLNLKNSKYDSESSQETYKQSIRNLLPNINLSSDYNIRYGRSTDPFTNDVTNTDFFSNNYSISSNIQLFEGFKKLNAIRAAKFIRDAEKEEFLRQKYLLAFRVMEAYYNIQFYEGLLANSLDQLKISETNYKLVESQIKVGLKAKADLYETESNLMSDQLLVTQHRNLVSESKLTLMQEMNFKENLILSQKPISIDKELENGFKVTSVDSIYDSASHFIPEIKALKLRLAAAEKQLQSARGDLYPSLAFFAGYRTGFFETNLDQNGELLPFRDQLRDNASRFVGISLNIPISDRWSNRSRVKQQKIAVLRAKNDLAIQEQQLFQVLQQLIQGQRALLNEKKQSEKRVRSQETTFKIAQKRYEKGLITLLELFQAKNMYGIAKNENLQTMIRLKMNKSTLDFYNGFPIFNIN